MEEQQPREESRREHEEAGERRKAWVREQLELVACGPERPFVAAAAAAKIDK